MADTILYSTLLLSLSNILYNFVQTYSHLTTTVANNNSHKPKLWFYLCQHVQPILHYASLDEILSHWTSRNAQLSSFEKLTIMNHEIQPLCPIKCNRFYISLPCFTKLGSFGYKVLSSLNSTTLIYIFVSKICLLLRAFETLLDFPLLCFKKMYNSTKMQPTSNVFSLIYLDFLNITKLDD